MSVVLSVLLDGSWALEDTGLTSRPIILGGSLFGSSSSLMPPFCFIAANGSVAFNNGGPFNEALYLACAVAVGGGRSLGMNGISGTFGKK